MNNRDLCCILYGIHVIWTGLWRNIEAASYKPNALWFCMTTGVIAIVAGFYYRKDRERLASIIAFCVTSVVFGFYLYEFVSSAETEATFRVGLVILSSIAQFVIIFLPARQTKK